MAILSASSNGFFDSLLLAQTCKSVSHNSEEYRTNPCKQHTKSYYHWRDIDRMAVS
jgi:hypothetical protein